MKSARAAVLAGAGALALLLVGNVSLAQVDGGDAATKDVRLPVPANRIELEGGHRADYVAGRKSEGWYRVAYHGVPLALRGTPSQYSDTIVLDRPRPEVGTADRSDLMLRFEEGTLAVGGGVFDMEGVRPIKLTGLENIDLRGTAFVASDSSFKQVQFAVGLETPSYPVPGLQGREISNWVVLGVNAQRRDATDSAGADDTFAAATYRMFIGKAWTRKGSAASTASLAQRIGNAFLRDAPTFSMAPEVDKKNKTSVKAADRSLLVGQFTNAVDDARTEIKRRTDAGMPPNAEEQDRIWATAARNIALGAAQTLSEQTTLALYAEFSGWYEFRGSSASSRQKSLFTLSADYWFMPGRDDVFLRLRYENGFERGAPAERKKQLLTSVALRF